VQLTRILIAAGALLALSAGQAIAQG